MDENIALVMFAAPLMGHLAQALELAKLMRQRNNQLSITVLIMEIPIDPEGTTKVHSLVSGCQVEGLHFHSLPTPDTSGWDKTNRGYFFSLLLEYQKANVRDAITGIGGLCGIIFDMVCIDMIEIAEDLGVASYVFFTSGAGFLGLLLHFQTLEDEHEKEVSDLVEHVTELVVPCFSNKVPIEVVPLLTTRIRVWSDTFLKRTRGFRSTKGIIVNTFDGLESYALQSFSSNSSYGKSGLPPIYPVGPILNRFPIQTRPDTEHSEMMGWLDAQPEKSVVFLCFGSMGSFREDQVKEIADALERSGYRFLWVLRRRSTEKIGFAGDFDNPRLVLSPGFFHRTDSIGKVVGWVPQLTVLSHPAVGGFVSHCGWNSTLESIRYGVPMATWPVYAEQQLNAFQLVKELGIAIQISLDFTEDNDQVIVKSGKIEKAIKDLMDDKNEVRERVKEYSEKGRLAMEEGGSSYLSLTNFIQNLG